MDSSSALLQVLHQHLLGRGEGMKRSHQTGEDLLELLGVFARRRHEAQRGLGIEAVQGVVSHTLLPLRGARPSRFLGVLAIRLSHPRRHFSSFDGHVVSPCQNGKGAKGEMVKGSYQNRKRAKGEMVKRRSRFPRFAIFPFPIFSGPVSPFAISPFPHLFRMTRQNETVETSETSETQNF